ncbi:MAG: hypothetical protein J6A73_08920 [Lachnospiraceae bacterium]|nr:hypothetical protein [Lachnospiraceae bacterium]MBO5342789.1 hypothetical protein [Lachnospiraceae bacterium]
MKKIILVTLTVATFFMMGCGSALSASDDEPESVVSGADESVSEDVVEADIELQEFMPELESYVVSIPEIEGGWNIYPEVGNGDHLILDNSDMTFTVMMQKFPKESHAYSDFASFQKFYMDGVTASMGEGVPQELEFDNDDILKYSANYYEMEAQGYVFKGQVAVFEMENGYYAGTITGVDSVYDANIETFSCLYDYFREQ